MGIQRKGTFASTQMSLCIADSSQEAQAMYSKQTCVHQIPSAFKMIEISGENKSEKLNIDTRCCFWGVYGYQLWEGQQFSSAIYTIS